MEIYLSKVQTLLPRDSLTSFYLEALYMYRGLFLVFGFCSFFSLNHFDEISYDGFAFTGDDAFWVELDSLQLIN